MEFQFSTSAGNFVNYSNRYIALSLPRCSFYLVDCQRMTYLFLFQSFQRITCKFNVLGHQGHQGSVPSPQIHELQRDKEGGVGVIEVNIPSKLERSDRHCSRTYPDFDYKIMTVESKVLILIPKFNAVNKVHLNKYMLRIYEQIHKKKKQKRIF